MANSGENISALFRSLGPDDASFQLAADTMAQESDLRWPIFKAVSVAKLEPTPELSAQEKLNRISQDKTAPSTRKPGLSLPALNQKLDLSLARIAEHSMLTVEQPNTRTLDIRTQPESLITNSRELSTPANTQGNVPSELPDTAIPEIKFSTEIGVPDVDIESTSFEHTAVLQLDVMNSPPDVNISHNSLQNIFDRIQGKKVERPHEQNGSFFDRLIKS